MDEVLGRIRMHLMSISALAKFEIEHPTGLSSTCLSLIHKTANKALCELELILPDKLFQEEKE